MAQKRKSTAKAAPSPTIRKEIFQITPIIIKGGSLDFSISRLKFKDDANKYHPHFKVDRKGRILEMSITGDIKKVGVGDGSIDNPLDITFDLSGTNGGDTEITINFLDES